MSVLVDTPIWSLALRRRPGDLGERERRLVRLWGDLVGEGEAVLIGPIRQEVLSGLRDHKAFKLLADRLGDFDDLDLERTDFVQAAASFNRCRSRGVTGSAIDLLICAVAHRCDVAIFTTDADFARYTEILSVRLFASREMRA